MSSKIDPAHMMREKRGQPKSLSDLPLNIQTILKSIHETCWSVWLYGSYKNGDWIEDSDLDIAVKDFRTYSKIIKNIWLHYNINIDIAELNKDYHLIIIK